MIVSYSMIHNIWFLLAAGVEYSLTSWHSPCQINPSQMDTSSMLEGEGDVSRKRKHVKSKQKLRRTKNILDCVRPIRTSVT